MERRLLARQPRDELIAEGVAGLAAVALASVLPFAVTADRCDTSPPDDTSSAWSFSGYCQAFHAVHLFNSPDTVSGGGVLEGVFVLPTAIVAGLMIALRVRRSRPIRGSLLLSGALVLLLTVLAFTLASATFHGV
jgi:hypothetical protein